MSTEIRLPVSTINSAAERLQLTVPVLAERIGVPKTKSEKFSQGLMGFTQAQQLATLLELPFGFLYLSELPHPVHPELPDFRTTKDHIPLDADFYDTLADIRRKLDWYADYLEVSGEKEKLLFVGKFSPSDDVRDVVTDIRVTLGNISRANDKNTYLRHMVAAFEKQGVLVFRNGVVGNNTRRKLDPQMFRGFAIADPFTPAIFINTNDAYAAQLFTLIHEAAHIWLGESAVSAPTILDDNKVERFCNQVAAEFLMPSTEFHQAWRAGEDLKMNLATLAKMFNVSQYAVVIKALELEKIGKSDFQRWQQENRPILPKEKASGGGDFFKTLPLRNSRRLTDIIARAALEKRILLRDGAKLLNTRPENIITYLGKG